jgi:uncharacterized protein YycO
MSKLLRLNSHHLINNFPKGSPFFKRVIQQAVFLLMVTKVTLRKNYLTDADLSEARSTIQKGDVILAGGFRSVSGLFLGKFFTHSLLYQGDGECIHAAADGVDTVTLDELFNEYDNLAIMRPNIQENQEAVIEKAIDYAREQLGKPYDFYFEHGYDRHYCTLLINTAFLQAGFDMGLKVKRPAKKPLLVIRLRRVLKADNFLRGNFQMVFLSGNLKDKQREIEELKKKYR